MFGIYTFNNPDLKNQEGESEFGHCLIETDTNYCKRLDAPFDTVDESGVLLGSDATANWLNLFLTGFIV